VLDRVDKDARFWFNESDMSDEVLLLVVANEFGAGSLFMSR
jgi:hypothetical protein